MKNYIAIRAGLLKEAIRKALKAVPKPSSGVEKDIMTISADKGSIYVHAADDGQSIRVLVSNELDLGSSLLVGVNGKNLEKLVTSFDDDVILKIEPDSTGLAIKYGRNKLVLPHLTDRQQAIFECHPNGEGEKILTVASRDLAAAIHSVEHAAARQDARIFLCGVLFDFTRGRLRLRSSNGLGMLTYDTPIPVSEEHGQVILPIAFAEPLSNLLAKDEGAVDLRLIKNATGNVCLVAETSSIVFKAQLIGAKYPALTFGVDAVSEFANPVIFQTDEFRSALNRLQIVGCAVRRKEVSLQVQAGELFIRLIDHESVECIPVQGEDTILTGVRTDVLLALLDRFTSSEVVFQMPSSVKGEPYLFGEPDQNERVLLGALAQFVIEPPQE